MTATVSLFILLLLTAMTLILAGGLVFLILYKRALVAGIMQARCAEAGIELRIAPEFGRLGPAHGRLPRGIICLTPCELLWFPLLGGNPVRINIETARQVTVTDAGRGILTFNASGDIFVIRVRDPERWQTALGERRPV